MSHQPAATRQISNCVGKLAAGESTSTHPAYPLTPSTMDGSGVPSFTTNQLCGVALQWGTGTGRSSVADRGRGRPLELCTERASGQGLCAAICLFLRPLRRQGYDTLLAQQSAHLSRASSICSCRRMEKPLSRSKRMTVPGGGRQAAGAPIGRLRLAR
jgi:hypothetical protein